MRIKTKCYLEKVMLNNCMQNFVKAIYVKVCISYFLIQDRTKNQRSIKKEVIVLIFQNFDYFFG